MLCRKPTNERASERCFPNGTGTIHFPISPYKKQVTIDSPRYDIVAKVPQGATKEQLSVMLQNLLIQRVKLAWHYEKKEIPVYDLVVGKNGPKLKPSPPLDPKAADGVPPAPVRPPLDPDGLPLLLARRNSTANFIGHNGTTRRTLANDSTMEQLADLLSSRLQRPVINATGLKGKYDYVLTYTGDPARGPIMDTGGAPPPPPSDAPTIFAAVQEQLGLKLEQKKGMVDTFVVDHLEKTPIGN